MELWKYVAIAVAAASGIVGVFFAKEGKINEIRGVGWVAVVLILLTAVVGSVLNFKEARSKEEGAAKAERAEVLSRRTEAALAAVTRTGVNPSLAVGTAYLNFAVPMTGKPSTEAYDEASSDIRVGPFPKLAEGRTARLSISIPGFEDFDYTATLTGKPGGKLDLVASDARAETYAFSDRTDVASHGGAPDAQPQWQREPLPDEPTVYSLGLSSQKQNRALIDRLTVADRFGTLDVDATGLSPAQRTALIKTMERDVKPSLVWAIGFSPPSPEGAAEEEADECINRIRVPMRWVRVDDAGAGPNRLIFALNADPDGFKPEVCGWQP